MKYKVYMHTFPNGKRYIGITSQSLTRRWRINGCGYEGQPVYAAILKYGWENIRHEILASDLSKDQAEQKEIEMIKAYDSTSHRNGYNIKEGGNTSLLSEETKKKLSIKAKGRMAGAKHWNYGKHWSDEVKQKLSIAHQGKKMSEELRQKLSVKNRGINNPMYGVKMTKEHKKKLQAACVKATSKAVRCIETGVVYKSAAEARRKTGILANMISYCCRKKGYYKTAGGYHWEFY